MPISGNFVESKELFFTISLLINVANFPYEFLLCENVQWEYCMFLLMFFILLLLLLLLLHEHIRSSKIRLVSFSSC
jgi:hypothetical protein